MSISTAVPPSAVARVLGIATEFVNRRGGRFASLPQRVAVVGQGASNSTYPTTKATFTSSLAVAQTYGFGCPLHLAARQLLPDNGDGLGVVPMTIYPLEDAGGAVASTGNIIPAGAQTVAASYIVRISNIDSQPFVINAGDSVATITSAMTNAINSELNMPVTATDNTTDVDVVSKWAGASADTMTIEIIGTTTAGTTFTITQPTGGLVDPDVQPALDQIGDVWETMILNCLNTTNSTALDAYAAWGEGRWGALTRKPAVVFTGTITTDVADAIVIPSGRKTDRVNAQLVSPGSNDLTFVVAARQLARIAVLANENPAHDYGSQVADGLTPGADEDQWLYADRDLAVKGGSSTVEIKNEVVNISDVVTYYHPDGDPLPPYRFVVDIVKLQNVIFNIDLEFAQSKWDGAPLIPDSQPTTNPDAKKPRTAVAAAAAIVENLGLAAILSDTASSVDLIVAEIDSANPKRLNLCIPVNVSGNTNIKSIDLKWGFYFGTPTTVTV